MNNERIETCTNCPAFNDDGCTNSVSGGVCQYNIGSVPRINCELGEILMHEKYLEIEIKIFQDEIYKLVREKEKLKTELDTIKQIDIGDNEL